MYIKIKRIIDIIISFILLLILWIPMLIIVICIKIEDKGLCIYKSKRIGKNLIPFYIYKFRTMKNTRKEFQSNLKHEEAVTKIGKILRKTSLDELPQLINVLKGEMSLIGPRPWVPEYYKYFTEEQKKRINVLPGISGLAQVNGRNGIDVFKKIEYDLQYIETISFKQDVKIFFKTIKIIFSKKNAEITEKEIKEEIEKLRVNKHMKNYKL